MEFYGFMAYVMITKLGWRVEDIKKLTVGQIEYIYSIIKGE